MPFNAWPAEALSHTLFLASALSMIVRGIVAIETIPIVFTGISISLAAFYYINNLRNNQRNQQMQLEPR